MLFTPRYSKYRRDVRKSLAVDDDEGGPIERCESCVVTFQSRLVFTLGLLAVACGPGLAWGQRVQFPSTIPAGADPTGLAPVPGAANPAAIPSTIPSTIPGAPAAGGSGATLGAPPADFYSTTPLSPSAPMSPAPYGTAPGAPTTPGATQPWNVMPNSTAPGYPGATYPPAYPPGGYPGTGYPGTGYPAGGQPSSLFPNGVWPGNTYGSQAPPRLIDNLRSRGTWLYSNGDDDALGIVDIEVATTIQIPHFLGSTQPLLIAPNFALHLWDGPKNISADLPGSAYSAYLEIAYKTNPQNLFGADLTAGVGVFSDFNSATTDSIRFPSLGYGWIRLTPNTMLKLGVQYLDRVDLQLLPAVGILYEPNPRMKLDIFFPRPKLSWQFSKVGTTDVWLFLAGEYGGGAWTVERTAGYTDEVDINDIRVTGGFEWVGQSGLRGVLEAGWVTSRDLNYRYTPADNMSPPDTFMIRAGLVY